MGKPLTREQNLNMRLGSARAQAERALLEAIQNRFETGELGFNETINMLVNLVAELRIESYEKVASVATTLITEYNRALENKSVAIAAALSNIRNLLNAHEQYGYENQQTFDQINSASRLEDWKIAATDVNFPSFPDP